MTFQSLLEFLYNNKNKNNIEGEINRANICCVPNRLEGHRKSFENVENFAISKTVEIDDATIDFGNCETVRIGTMLDIFRGLKNLIKVSHVKTDSPVFRLHYSITVMILMSFSLIITTRQYVGNPIDCVHTKDIPEDVLNTYCWIHSTYAIKSYFYKRPGISVPYPGIGNSDGDPNDKKHYKYYQWVCFCLFFQVRSILHQ